jgi:hypothetical protein
MAIVEKVTQEDLYLYELIRHPVLFGEFIQNIDRKESDPEYVLTLYQKEFLCDYNSYVSIRAARATGKTEGLTLLLIWLIVYGLFDDEYVVYTVPNRAQLEPVWNRLTLWLRTNSLLRNFIEPKKGINSSSYRVKLKNAQTLICRIAGQSGDGRNIIGLHTPFVILDECIVGTQRVYGNNSTNKRVSELNVGDIVLSWDGENVVEDRIKSIKKIKRTQRVFEIQFKDSHIRVGENHRIYTDNGYKKAKDLINGEYIYFYRHTIRKYWTTDEIDYVKEQIKKSVSVKEIAKNLYRSTQSVFRKIDSLGLSVREIYDSKSLTEEEYQVILGSFLGDGSAEIENTRARYRANHSLKQKEYVDWLRNKLDRLVRADPNIYKNGGWGTLNYSLHTLGHPDILKIAEELYINNKKTVTREYLNKLTPLGLAIWWMDDGSESGMLSTHSFSKEENKIIVKYLKEVWNIDSKIYHVKSKDLYCILIRNKSLDNFRDIIKPYIPDCMKYKIGEGKYNNSLPNIDIIESGEKNETLEKTKIIGIREVKRTRADYLYDIEVENNHNFFVNGILTKNSGYYPWGTYLELLPIVNRWQDGFRLITSGVPTGVREENVLWHTDMENESYTKHRFSAYDNPRFDEEQEEAAIQQYGGKDTEDFAHFIKGEHGSPVFSIFDRRFFKIDSYPVYKLALNGTKMGDNLGNYIEKFSLLPKLPDSNRGVIFGIDLGYTDPTAIIILYLNTKEQLKFHSRIRLYKVPYDVQERLIDYLDDRYKPIILGVDEGHAGIAVTQRLMNDEEYIHKNYDSRLYPVNFSSSIVLGTDSDGEEIKSKTKPYSVSILQDYSDKSKLIYSSTDPDMISELERMTYSKNPRTGSISYKTLTPKGGKRGKDHFTSALLCGVLAYHLTIDELIKSRKKKVKLFRPRWNW